MADKVNHSHHALPNVIELNVGGQLFTTLLATLTSDPGSMLAAMFSGRHLLDKDSQARIFIDRDGALFHHVLNFLRDGSLPAVEVRPAVLTEAEYFQLKFLVNALQMSTGEMAEDKVRADILKRFPKYDEVKRRLVNCAVERAGKAGILVDVDVTFLVYEGANVKNSARGSNCKGKKTGTHYGNCGPFNHWFARTDVVKMDLSDFGIGNSELQGEDLENFIASVSALMVADLVDDGFKVTFFPNGSNLKHKVSGQDKTGYICLTEVNFRFTFLPCSLPSIRRDKF